MKHRSPSTLILAVLLAGTLASCSNFTLDSLFTNQFKAAGLGQVSATKIADAPAADLIDQSGIAAGQISQSFFEALAADPALAADTLVKLDDLMTPAAIQAQPEVAQAAIALAVQINLKEVQADEIINNAPAAIALLTNPDFKITNPTDLKTFLDLLIPADLGKALFTAEQLTGIRDIVDKLILLESNGYFEKLADSLDANGGKFKDGLDSGTLAQVALIVKVIKMVEPAAGYSTLGEAVAALLDNFPADNNFDNFHPEAYIDYTYLMDHYEEVLNDPALTTLLSAAGIDLQKLIDQFSNK